MKLHSIVDLITNSSSEIFILNDKTLSEQDVTKALFPDECCKDCPLLEDDCFSPIEVFKDDGHIMIKVSRHAYKYDFISTRLNDKFGKDSFTYEEW